MPAATLDEVVALCKRRGLIFPASEIYGGIANTYDYGHYGVLLKRNVSDLWWKAMIQERDDIVALDSAIIQHPKTWEASGHLAGFSRPARPVPGQVQAALPAGHAAGGGRGARRGSGDGQVPGLRRRPDRAARVQPDVPDDDRARPGGGLDRLPAPRDRAGHLPRLQDDAVVRAQEAAVRHRADRQVVPQRDHARELHLPHARVRADGDGVLRPARRGPAVVRVLVPGAPGLVHAARDPAREPAPAPAHRGGALALLERDERRRVPVRGHVARARGRRQPRRLRPHAARRSSRARSSSTRTRRPARATSRT